MAFTPTIGISQLHSGRYGLYGLATMGNMICRAGMAGFRTLKTMSCDPVTRPDRRWASPMRGTVAFCYRTLSQNLYSHEEKCASCTMTTSSPMVQGDKQYWRHPKKRNQDKKVMSSMYAYIQQEPLTACHIFPAYWVESSHLCDISSILELKPIILYCICSILGDYYDDQVMKMRH